MTFPIKFRPLMLFPLVLTTACTSMQTGPQYSASVPSAKVATVYFYRAPYSPGAVVGVDIKDNGIDLGALPDGTYFVYHATPGQHTFHCYHRYDGESERQTTGWCDLLCQGRRRFQPTSFSPIPKCRI